MRRFRIDKAMVREFKTKKGKHIYIEVKGCFTAETILLWQIFLWSDIEREFLNYKRILDNIDLWNVLFQKKWNKNKVVSKEINEFEYLVQIGKD